MYRVQFQGNRLRLCGGLRCQNVGMQRNAWKIGPKNRRVRQQATEGNALISVKVLSTDQLRRCALVEAHVEVWRIVRALALCHCVVILVTPMCVVRSGVLAARLPEARNRPKSRQRVSFIDATNRRGRIFELWAGELCISIQITFVKERRS